MVILILTFSITAKLYRILALTNKKDKEEYLPYLNQVIKERKKRIRAEIRVKLRNMIRYKGNIKKGLKQAFKKRIDD